MQFRRRSSRRDSTVLCYSAFAFQVVTVQQVIFSYCNTTKTDNFTRYSLVNNRRRRLVWHLNSIWASTNQDQGQGFIILPPRAAALPRLDDGCGGVKPTSICLIQNLQTSCSSW